MTLSIEERIARLRAGIESPSTPENIREDMREALAELENPETEPIAEPAPVVKVKKPLVMVLPHHTYFAENNIDEKALPLEIRRKIGGLRMLMGKDTEKIRIKAVEVSNNIVEIVKKHLTPPEPPPPPPRVFTEEEKAERVAEYERLKARKKERANG